MARKGFSRLGHNKVAIEEEGDQTDAIGTRSKEIRKTSSQGGIDTKQHARSRMGKP